MNLNNEISKRLADHIALAHKLEGMTHEIASAVDLVVKTLRSGNKILLAGNGGSAADAQHWAAEWVIRLSPSIQRPALPAIALSTDTSSLTAGGNDLGFDAVFERQVEGFARMEDLLIVISTSGNSENLIRAAHKAQSKGAIVLGILGKGGGRLKDNCDMAIVVPSNDTQRIQEMHCFIGHQLCELSEKVMFA
jgi:D-sedoheptulose 7-phosphate isomerase